MDGAFSLSDLYGLLCNLKSQRPSDRNKFLMGVVEGKENIVAFATKGSLEKVRNSFNGSYEDFASYWYSKYGWQFDGSGSVETGGGERAHPIVDNAPKVWKIKFY